jgi:hypothetical protein
VFELQADVAALQESNHQLLDERRTLQSELAALREAQALKESLFYVEEKRSYWRQGEGTADDGPYCQVCWDVDEKLVRAETQSTERRPYCRYCGYYRGKS